MRKPLVIANWKMNGSRLSLAALTSELKSSLANLVGDKGIDVVLCPPHVYVPQLAEQLAGTAIALGAQDLGVHEKGAHTGDVAGEMLKEFGCRLVLVGHSERRASHHENDALVAQKVRRALACGLQPVLCVGETLAEREVGKTLAIIGAQLDAVYRDMPIDSGIVIAYEPIWAIGTGETATAAQAQEVHRFIRERLGKAGEKTRILYGGSVKAENAQALFGQVDIDGGLVGSASLDAKEFVGICKAAL